MWSTGCPLPCGRVAAPTLQFSKVAGLQWSVGLSCWEDSSLAGELLARARREDPVIGFWRVNTHGSVSVN